MGWLWFTLGLVSGATLGCVALAALVAGKAEDDLAARRRRR